MNFPKIVIYDACVLYPAPLRDLLIRLAIPGMFKAHWTARIQQEWSSNLLAKRLDIDPHAIATTQILMERALPEACIVGYDIYIDDIHLPDTDDRHVLAAAIFAGAKAIVTCNLKDFPPSVLNTYGVTAVHPDIFIMQVAKAFPNFVHQVAHEQHQDLQHSPKTWKQFLEILHKQGIPQTYTFLSKE